MTPITDYKNPLWMDAEYKHAQDRKKAWKMVLVGGAVWLAAMVTIVLITPGVM